MKDLLSITSKNRNMLKHFGIKLVIFSVLLFFKLVLYGSGVVYGMRD